MTETIRNIGENPIGKIEKQPSINDIPTRFFNSMRLEAGNYCVTEGRVIISTAVNYGEPVEQFPIEADDLLCKTFGFTRTEETANDQIITSWERETSAENILVVNLDDEKSWNYSLENVVDIMDKQGYKPLVEWEEKQEENMEENSITKKEFNPDWIESALMFDPLRRADCAEIEFNKQKKYFLLRSKDSYTDKTIKFLIKPLSDDLVLVENMKTKEVREIVLTYSKNEHPDEDFLGFLSQEGVDTSKF